MIDHAALQAYPFRSAPFSIDGSQHTYQWEGRVDCGAILVRTMDRAYCGEVRASDIEGRWVSEQANGKTNEYFSRDAAFYALIGAIAERNAEYDFNIAQFERNRQAV